MATIRIGEIIFDNCANLVRFPRGNFEEMRRPGVKRTGVGLDEIRYSGQVFRCNRKVSSREDALIHIDAVRALLHSSVEFHDQHSRRWLALMEDVIIDGPYRLITGDYRIRYAIRLLIDFDAIEGTAG